MAAAERTSRTSLVIVILRQTSQNESCSLPPGESRLFTENQLPTTDSALQPSNDRCMSSSEYMSPFSVRLVSNSALWRLQLAKSAAILGLHSSDYSHTI